MHILFLTDNFPPEGNAPATRTYEHAREWIRQGHKVTVITGVPNFPEGKVFFGYQNKWYQKEEIDGIEIRRVKTYIIANEGFIKRSLDFISFMVSGFFAGLFVKKPDVVIGTSPQFFTVCGAWALSVVRRKPFVFELRDIWPASITAVGAMKKSKIIRILERIEMFLYRRADLIVSVTHSFKQELMERGVDGNKISVVLNGVDLSMYAPAQQKDVEYVAELGLANKFVVGYVGTHGMAHALDKVVEAAHKLKDRTDIVFLFAGGGAYKKQLDQLVSESGLTNIISIPRQPKENMPRLWSLCDVSLISLKDAPLFKTVIPSKIFESMGMGLPMVVSVPEGEATDIVKGKSAGVVVTPECPDELAAAIAKLYENNLFRKELANNSYQASRAYSRERLAKSMLNYLNNVS